MNIPVFPEYRSVDIADKALLDRFFSQFQPRISELTFANIFLFRNAHDYRLSRVGESLIIFGTGYISGDDYFLPPIGGDVTAALERLLMKGHTLYGADDGFVKAFCLDNDMLEISEDRDAFDYLYRREDLALLPGNRYHKKMNRVRYFTARHQYSVKLFSYESRDGALQLLDDWARIRAGNESRSRALEVAATAEGLNMAEQLGLEGVVVLVDGKVCAFALGERLRRGTSVCHFEKADPFLEGLYQLVGREFNGRCFTDCTYVNREQDLGEPSLRASKLSYHPVELVKKFRVRMKRCDTRG